MGWEPEPSVIAGCTLFAVGYFWTTRGRPWPRALALVAADTILLLALISPIDTLGERSLFSAHMLQHLLLLELVAPLFIVAIPAALARRWLRRRWVARIEARLRRPARAWAIGFLTLALWHIPWFYDLALRNDGLHACEHLSFLISACIFWWPVLAPLAASRLDTVAAVFYLFARMAANLMLGTLIVAAPVGLYAAYAHRTLPLPFGLTPILDQQIGGFLMWVPTLLIDAAAAPLLLALFLKPAAPHVPTSPAATNPAAPAALRG
ncbi:MAG TPA: cytochrome c oxidase assembly protein [Terriglobales bacterium]|nr:cytochrome c oxidase assembly protein [Terriglobales bacterium]